MYTVSLFEYNTTPTATVPTPATDELYIYDPLTTDEGLMLTEPILSLEASCAGSFSCTLPETNYGYGRIIRHRTRLAVRKDDKIIFMGRINTDDRDLYLNQKIEAEGALAYLNDSLTEKKTFTKVSLEYLLNYIFTNHNNKFPDEPWKQFNFPYDVTTDTSTNCNAKFTGRDNEDVNSNKISYYSVNFYTSMETVSELLNLANAVLKLVYNSTTGKWDVYIYDKYNLPKASQPIEFGKNLIDLIQSYDATEICSAVAPFGGDAIQEDKSIGEKIGGARITGDPQDITQYSSVSNFPTDTEKASYFYEDAIYVRPKDNASAAYSIYSANEPGYGYWVARFNIAVYNNAHPNNHLKKLYLSWRGNYFETIPEEPAGADKCEDCSWRVYDASWDSIGYRKIERAGGATIFDSAVNEEIDLTDPQYKGATYVIMCGHDRILTPCIRRDATVVEEADKLSIHDCDAFGSEESEDLVHEANSYYLYSKSLEKSFGRVEKKLEYDIEDQTKPLSTWVIPSSGTDWSVTMHLSTCLGYNSGDGTDLESNKGNYEIVPFGDDAFRCIEYEIPPIGSPNRPKGIFVSSRFYTFGTYEYNGYHYQMDGLYAVFDAGGYVLAYKKADGEMFTQIENEYIDLSDAKFYGAKKIRVGGWNGAIQVNLVPNDDSYSRNKLLAQAELYLTKQQWEKKVVEATAVDLNMTSSDWESFDICTDVEVLSDFHGIEGVWYPLTKLDLQLDMFENNIIKLGYDSDEYLSYQLSENLRLQSVAQTIEERRKEET